jgi:uncharacterized ubiquitin-like protein YukD
MEITVVWDVVSYSMVEFDLRLEVVAACVIRMVVVVVVMMMETVSTSEASGSFYQTSC